MGWLVRGHDDRAGRSITAIDRALRALNDFDLAQVGEFAIEGTGIGHLNAVDHEGEGGLCVASTVHAANIDLRVALLGGLHEADAGNHGDKITGALNARGLEGACGERHDCCGHVLQIFGPLASGDDDFINRTRRACRLCLGLSECSGCKSDD